MNDSTERRVVWLPGALARTLNHMRRELMRSRVLLAGIVLATGVAAARTIAYGRPALLTLGVNYLLLLLYAVIIYSLTQPEPPARPRVRNPRLELALFLAYAAWIALSAFSTEIPYVSEGLRAVTEAGLRTLNPLDPFWAMHYRFGIWPAFFVLALPWLLWTVIGYGPAELGLRPRRLRTAAALIALGVLPALWELAQRDPRDTLVSGIGAFLIATVLAGLAGEFFHRGILLPRLEAVMTRRLDALAVSGFVVAAIRVPALLSSGEPVLEVAGVALSGFGDPFNLALGYLYLRTRSVWPGAVWWAASGTVAIVFL